MKMHKTETYILKEDVKVKFKSHHSSGLKVPASSDFFSDYFPGAQLKIINFERGRVADYLNQATTEDLIYGRSREETYQEFNSFLVKAPTGAGKNYWCREVLRPIAKKRGKKVLYLCNRNAVYEQEILAAKKAVDPITYRSGKILDGAYAIGRMIICKYQSVLKYLQECDVNPEDFEFIVLDEFHFFLADCTFNMNTEKILQIILSRFSGVKRVYMTATPEDVLDVIYSLEWKNLDEGDPRSEKNCVTFFDSKSLEIIEGKHKLPVLLVMNFPNDFSIYSEIYAYEKNETLINEIVNEGVKKKWVVFVSSIDEGRKMKKDLDAKGFKTAFLCAESKDKCENEESFLWRKIIESKRLVDIDILVSTSVLDNGFGLEDREIGNIVLDSDSRVEFLQELGRVRMIHNEEINLYFRKMTKSKRINKKKIQETRDVFVKFYGNEEIKEAGRTNAEISPNPFDAYSYACEIGAKFIGLVPAGCNDLSRVEINNFARLSAKQRQDELDEYEKLESTYNNDAKILVKAQWIERSVADVIDLEIPKAEMVEKELKQLLEDYGGKKLTETSEQNSEVESEKNFIMLSKEVEKLFKRCCKGDSSINPGKNRKTAKHKATNTRFEKISKKYGVIELQLKKEKDHWILVRA